MKKLIIIVSILVLSLAGCNDASNDKEASTAVNQNESTETTTELTTNKIIANTATVDENTTAEPITEPATTESSTTDKTDIETDSGAISNISLDFVDRDTYIPNGRTPQLLVDVILNNAEFYDTYSKRKTTLDKFRYEDYEEEFEIYEICVVDLDNDYINEIVVYPTFEAAVVFHYEDGTVYSFNRNYRGTKCISCLQWISQLSKTVVEAPKMKSVVPSM